LRYQVRKLLIRNAKTEIGREPLFMSPHRFVEAHGQNRGRHDRAVLGESHREKFSVSTASRL